VDLFAGATIGFVEIANLNQALVVATAVDFDHCSTPII
jgi:hypothetical protein